VVLHAERFGARSFKSLTAPIVQVKMTGLGDCAKCVNINHKTVVLTGDFDAPGGQILHRLIQAAVAKLELVGACTKCAREQLVSQADTKDRLLTKKFLNHIDGV